MHEDVVIITAHPVVAKHLAQFLVCAADPPRPCLACENCRCVETGRHIDVLRCTDEDLRNPELIESMRHGPVSARHKVYLVGGEQTGVRS